MNSIFPDARLVEVSQNFANPPPPVAASESSEEPDVPPPSLPEPEVTAVGGLPATLGTSSSFHFMQEDELEAATEELQQSTSDWVQVHNEPEPEQVEVTEIRTEVDVNGHSVVEGSVTVTTISEVSPSRMKLVWRWC